MNGLAPVHGSDIRDFSFSESLSYDADEINGTDNETRSRIIECNLGARFFAEIQIS